MRVLASGSMVLIGRRFVTVSESKNQAEAEYRYVLTRLSENGESIAVLGGEDEERARVDKSLTTVLRRWRDICVQTMRTTIVSQTSGYIAPVLPIILCAPKYLERLDDAGRGHAGGIGLHDRAGAHSTGWSTTIRDWPIGPPRLAASSSLMVSLDALERAEGGEGVGRIERGETDRRGAAAARSLGHAR